MASADLIVHAGDFSSVAAYEELAALGPPLVAVHGNVDELALRERLPEQLVLEAGPVRIGLVHDAGPARGRIARIRRRFPEADAVVFGHSHIPLHERDGGFSIFNPGSPTERRRAPSHTMGIATVEQGRARFEHVTLD
jgi:putative phosphoesterase